MCVSNPDRRPWPYSPMMANRGLSPFVEPRQIHARSRRLTIYGVAMSILFLLALVGLVAILLLILGLENVHSVTEHFRVH